MFGKVAIGMIHFSPMVGFEGFTSYEDILAKALLDLDALEKGDIDMIMVENNYDLPHVINISKETYDMMKRLILEIKKHTKKKMGISILWNDYRSALRMAKETGSEFVRVPVFVDHVKTDYGTIKGDPEDVLSYREKIGDVKILTDIQVKHSKLLNVRPIAEAAKEAIDKGSDGLIITGKWTGDAPDLKELKEIKNAVKDFPILLGSGVDRDNVKELLHYCNGVIISTSLKEGVKDSNQTNLKPYQSKLDEKKIKEFMDVFRS